MGLYQVPAGANGESMVISGLPQVLDAVGASAEVEVSTGSVPLREARFLLEESGVTDPISAQGQLPKKHNLLDTRAARHGAGTVYGGNPVHMPFTARF